jgi:hypothetical protein
MCKFHWAVPTAATSRCRQTFIRYLLKIDAGRMNIPGNPAYSQIGNARSQIEGLLPRRPHVAASKKPPFKRGPRKVS